MVQDFEELLSKADFTKESGLYGELKKKLLSQRSAGTLRDYLVSEDDLEELAAAGTDAPDQPKPDKLKR